MRDKLPDDPEQLKQKVTRLQEDLEESEKRVEDLKQELEESEDPGEELKQELDEVSKQLSGTHSELLAILDSMQGQGETVESESLADDSDSGYGAVDVSPLEE